MGRVVPFTARADPEPTILAYERYGLLCYDTWLRDWKRWWTRQPRRRRRIAS